MLQIERYNVLFQAEGLVTGMKRPGYTVKCQVGFTHLLMTIPLTYSSRLFSVFNMAGYGGGLRRIMGNSDVTYAFWFHGNVL